MTNTYNVEQLSNEQLLEALLVTEPCIASEIYNRSGSLRNLSQYTYEQLTQFKGIGKKKAMMILSAFELGRRLMKDMAPISSKMDNAQSIVDFISPSVKDLDHEEAFLLILDNAMRLKKFVKLSSGGMTETAIDTRIVIRETLYAKGTCIVLIHNHPSSSCLPSRNDDDITERIRQSCEIMRIHIIDHIVISSSTLEYFSYSMVGKL